MSLHSHSPAVGCAVRKDLASPAISITERNRVALLVGLATDERAFGESKASSPDSFEAKFSGYEEYTIGAQRPLELCMQEWLNRGMFASSVREGRDLCARFGGIDVAVVLTHFAKGRVQIGRDMLGPEDFARAIPTDRSLMIDMSSCANESFVWSLKSSRSASNYRYSMSEVDLTLLIWTKFYTEMAVCSDLVFPPYLQFFEVMLGASVAAWSDLG